jgi:hypothetical protein
MTTRELLTECADDNNLGTLTPQVRARLLRYLNQGLRRILSMPGMALVANSDPPFTFTSVADQPRVVLPESVVEVSTITERDNDTRLDPLTLDLYRRLAPDPTQVSGTPTHYVPLGRVALATLPSNASELFVKSTSALDVAPCTLRGVITDGYQRSVSVTMTGATAVSLNTSITSWIDVSDWFVSVPAVGTITLHEDSGAGTELARITIGQHRPRYQGFYLYPTPSGAITYYVDSRRRTVELKTDEDEPPWDEDYHWVLGAYARMRQYEKTKDARYLTAKEDFGAGLAALIHKTTCPPERLPVPGGFVDRGSNLGPFFPPGRW